MIVHVKKMIIESELFDQLKIKLADDLSQRFNVGQTIQQETNAIKKQIENTEASDIKNIQNNDVVIEGIEESLIGKRNEYLGKETVSTVSNSLS